MTNRSVFITGGNRGIGAAAAQAFVAQGDRVAVSYRSGTPPKGVFAVRCDVTDPASLQEAFAQVEAEQGPVEVLVANAGITRDAISMRMDDDVFQDVLETNLVGSFRAAREAAKGMLTMRRGRIIFVSSVMGWMGSPGQVNYAASKAGMMGLARSLAWELGSRNVTVNVVAPGIIDTDMIEPLSEKRKAGLIQATPLGGSARRRRSWAWCSSWPATRPAM